MFVARHIPQLNSLNWIINDVPGVEYNKLKIILASFYGEKYSSYISDVPSERPSIYNPLQ
jgi:hypothetical protein